MIKLLFVKASGMTIKVSEEVSLFSLSTAKKVLGRYNIVRDRDTNCLQGDRYDGTQGIGAIDSSFCRRLAVIKYKI